MRLDRLADFPFVRWPGCAAMSASAPRQDSNFEMVKRLCINSVKRARFKLYACAAAKWA
jgi:hypothetical protein